MPLCIRMLFLLAALALPGSALAAGPLLVAQAPPPNQPVNPNSPGKPVPQKQVPQTTAPTAPVPNTQSGQQGVPTQPVPKAQPPRGSSYTPPPPKGRVSSGPPGVVPSGPPVVAPPGSVIVPPGAVVPKPGRSSRGRAADVARCNQIQANCANRCNHATFGQSRNMCYNQCNTQFVTCTNRANVRP